MTPSTRLRLRVIPGARRSGVAGRYGDAWKVRVSAPPERGSANDELLRVLAATLSVPARSITLVSGHGSRDKIVELAGITPAETESRMASAERKESSR